MPVFLITLFAKGEKANLTKVEQNALAKLAKSLKDSLTTPMARKGRV